jgi:hypothetical protein
VSVQLFFNPELVGQLAACGITTRRRAPSGAPAAGFVLESRRVPARGREAITNVIAVRNHVPITGPRDLPARPAVPALPAPSSVAATSATTTSPQTALELAEENARLRRDNQRLTNEVERLRGEVARLTAGPNAPRPAREQELDDAATRFSLLELE